MTLTVDEAFHPPGEHWHPISPKLATVRRWIMAGWVIVITLIAMIVFAAGGLLIGMLLCLLVAVPVFVWLWWLIGRRVRSFGYVERDDDLLVTSGILFRRLVIVPYGRMQLVDLVAGPLERALGLSTVQLHTAAATTDAKIPGLAPDVAASLRDRLAAQGEERSAGI